MGPVTKKKVVVMLPNGGARIFINPPDISALKKLGAVMEEPDLSAVKGVSPAFWVESNGVIGLVKEPKLSFFRRVFNFLRKLLWGR